MALVQHLSVKDQIKIKAPSDKIILQSILHHPHSKIIYEIEDKNPKI
jgi:hypothetical protein